MGLRGQWELRSIRDGGVLTEGTPVNGVHENHAESLEERCGVGDLDTLFNCSIEDADFEVDLFAGSSCVYSGHDSASIFDLASLDQDTCCCEQNVSVNEMWSERGLLTRFGEEE